MKTTWKYIRLAINILLGLGCFAVLNESDSFTPNLIGLACFALLIVINPTGDAWMQFNDKNKK